MCAYPHGCSRPFRGDIPRGLESACRLLPDSVSLAPPKADLDPGCVSARSREVTYKTRTNAMLFEYETFSTFEWGLS